MSIIGKNNIIYTCCTEQVYNKSSATVKKSGPKATLLFWVTRYSYPGLAVSQAARPNLLSLATVLPVKLITLKSNVSAFAFTLFA